MPAPQLQQECRTSRDIHASHAVRTLQKYLPNCSMMTSHARERAAPAPTRIAQSHIADAAMPSSMTRMPTMAMLPAPKLSENERTSAVSSS